MQPFKFDLLIHVMKPDEVYTTATAIQLAKDTGLFLFLSGRDQLSPTQRKTQQKHLRGALTNFIGKYLPNKEDALLEVNKPFLAYHKAYLGSTWQNALKAAYAAGKRAPEFYQQRLVSLIRTLVPLIEQQESRQAEPNIENPDQQTA